MLLRLSRQTSVSNVVLISKRRYHVPVGLINDLTHRGFIQDVTRPDALQNALESRPQVVYAGVDPTAKSLHIGHLIPLMCLLHFQVRGHTIIPLIGSATGRIGDPSGRTIERRLADIQQVQVNVSSLTHSVQTFFKRALVYADTRLERDEGTCTAPDVTSNMQWHEKFTMLDFLQKVGIHARVNTMLNKESVRARLNAQQGLSFTEFTYQLLQAYDFYYLHKHYNCSIQVGGSDQWGNILAGLELIGKLEEGSIESPSESRAFGITTPLLTTSSGQKFGKSAGNAVWLDPNLTSVFDFYQYFIKVTDADVEKYLKLFTLLSWQEVDEIIAEHFSNPEKRVAQRRLAAEVTEMIHSRQEAKGAEIMSALLFDADYEGLDANHLIETFQGDPRLVFIERSEILSTTVTKLASKYGLVASTSAARALVKSGGLYLNNAPLDESQQKVQENQFIGGRIAILRAGKNKLLVLAAV